MTLLTNSPFAGFIALLVAAGWPNSSLAQADAEKQFGAVHFSTSCNETAQRRFDRGMRYQQEVEK